MEKYKNKILFSLIILSQIHTLFRECGSFYWYLNGITKTYSLSIFLFVKHLTVFVLYYITLKPKGVNRNFLLYLFILSALDILHFIILSGFGYGALKLVLSFLFVFVYLKIKK
jgi:hypothetical protein